MVSCFKAQTSWWMGLADQNCSVHGVQESQGDKVRQEGKGPDIDPKMTSHD